MCCVLSSLDERRPVPLGPLPRPRLLFALVLLTIACSAVAWHLEQLVQRVRRHLLPLHPVGQRRLDQQRDGWGSRRQHLEQKFLGGSAGWRAGVARRWQAGPAQCVHASGTAGRTFGRSPSVYRCSCCAVGSAAACACEEQRAAVPGAPGAAGPVVLDVQPLRSRSSCSRHGCQAAAGRAGSPADRRRWQSSSAAACARKAGGHRRWWAGHQGSGRAWVMTARKGRRSGGMGGA